MNRTPLVEGEWYHCYNRGVDKRWIFEDQKDFERFLMLLYVANSDKRIHLSDFGRSGQGPTLPEVLMAERGAPLVDVGAYCLMNNHFHLLMRPKVKNGLSLFMQKVSTGYSMYFNKKKERSGTLIQGKFKSSRVDNDAYFRRLINYIHANPAELYESGWKRGLIKHRSGLKKRLIHYPFSSLRSYLEESHNPIIDTAAVTSMLDKVFTVDDLIEEAIIFSQESPGQGRTLP
jgi:putative transposase